MSILFELSLALAALQAGGAGEPLFGRFAEVGVPYVECVEGRGGRENVIVPARGSNMSWASARAAFRQQYGADDTDCRFYATHEQLTRLVSQRHPVFDERLVGFIVQEALADLQRTGFRLENLERLTANGLPIAPPAPPSPMARDNAQNR